MLTRRFAVAALIPFALGACANNVSPAGAPVPSASAVTLPAESSPARTSPSGKPSSGGGETITGKVTAGVEPNCLLLQNATGSYLLVFRDPALSSAAPVGAQVTLVGQSQPKMMTTCQQGIPFVVSSVG
jgi:hypothetical protein